MPESVSLEPISELANLGNLGNYKLLERLAVGAYAEVLVAEEPRSVGEARRVVIKRALASTGEDNASNETLQHEKELLQRLDHPNVVSLLDQGSDNGLDYLVLEYVPGLDLWRLLRWMRKQNQSMSVNIALYIARKMLLALHALHSVSDSQRQLLEVIHCDVSPSNIMVSVYGEVCLIDLGSAHSKLLKNASPQKSKPAGIGKVNYVSPESLTQAQVDYRSDIFSAAVVTAELLLGEPLFSGPSELSVLLSIRDADITHLLQAGKNWPTGLVSVLVTALKKQPSERFESAAAFAEQLEVFSTDTEEECRAALARLSQEAMQAREVFVSPAATVATLPPQKQRTRSTAAPPPIITIEQAEDVVKERTSKQPIMQFSVNAPDGRQIGTFSYAQMIESIATGLIGLEDRVQSRPSSPFVPIREIPELARHLPMVTQALHLSNPPLPEGASSRPTLLTTMGVVARAALARYSGLIVFTLGEVQKEVYFKDGGAEYVRSNLASDLLGEYLLTAGAITRGELDMALAVMHKFDGKLGETLLALGLLNSLQLFKHIQDQVKNRILDLLQWPHAEVQFIEAAQTPQSGFPVNLEAWPLMFEAIELRFQGELERELSAETILRPMRELSSKEHARLPSVLMQAFGYLQQPVSWALFKQQLLGLVALQDHKLKPEYVAALLIHLELVSFEN